MNTSLQNHSDSFLGTFKEDAPFLLQIVFPLFILISLGYLVWRFVFTVNWFIWFAVPLFILEVYNFLNTIFFLYTTRKMSFPIWQKPMEGKKVDIFIPTYNEPTEIVEMTTIGAKAIVGINKVFVLDDGNREEIRDLARRLGVRYLARGENSDAKAGNLNYGLRFSDAEFIINVDCDHVPQPQFIERLLGYFRDPELAFIQTPQVFYNQDSIQHKDIGLRKLWNEQTMFYESIQAGKNRFNASFFCGSGAMIRRKALDSVGGYATGTATEDIHTSIKLHAKGWRSLFVQENLAFGLAPEDLKEYHKQRVRWGAGSLGLLYRSPDSPLRARGLTLMQRLCYFNSAMAYMEGTLKLFYFFVPLYVIFFSHNLLYIDIFSYLAIFIPFLFLSYLVTYLFSRKTYHFPFTEVFNIINIFSHIEALKGIVRIEKKFGVSIKVKRGKQSAIIFPGLILLALILGIGNLYGVYLLDRYSINSYVMIGILWNSFNLFFVLFGLYYLVAFNKKKREEHKFLVNLSGDISGVDSGSVTIKRLSLSGALIETTKPILDSTFELQFSAAGASYTLPSQLSWSKPLKDNYQSSIQFLEITQKERISLTLYFFHIVVPELFRNDFRFKEDSLSLPLRSQPAYRYLDQ